MIGKQTDQYGSEIEDPLAHILFCDIHNNYSAFEKDGKCLYCIVDQKNKEIEQLKIR
jgi:hypothetical protein